MDDKPDLLEKVIRFFCGAILGAVFGFIYGIQFGHDYNNSFPVFYFILGLFVLGFGFLAMKYGDNFWKNVLKFPWT